MVIEPSEETRVLFSAFPWRNDRFDTHPSPSFGQLLLVSVSLVLEERLGLQFFKSPSAELATVFHRRGEIAVILLHA